MDSQANGNDNRSYTDRLRDAMLGVPDPFGDDTWHRIVYDLTTIGVASYTEICAMDADELLDLWEYSVDRWNRDHPSKGNSN